MSNHNLTQRRRTLISIILTVFLIVILLILISSWIQKWLWMRQLDYAGIFWPLLSVQWEMFGLAFVAAYLYLWINFRLAAKNSAAFGAQPGPGPTLLSARNGVLVSGYGRKLVITGGSRKLRRRCNKATGRNSARRWERSRTC